MVCKEELALWFLSHYYFWTESLGKAFLTLFAVMYILSPHSTTMEKNLHSRNGSAKVYFNLE